MENDELKEIWNAYNRNIENVHKTNKQILKEMISHKSEKRMQIMKLQIILGIIANPFIFLIVIIPLILESTLTAYIQTGAILITLIFIYYFIQGIIYYNRVSLLKPAYDKVVETQKKILQLKRYVLRYKKYRIVLFTVTAGSVILIVWDKIPYDLPVKIIVFAVTMIAIYFWGNFKYKIYFHDRMNSLEREMNELKEFD